MKTLYLIISSMIILCSCDSDFEPWRKKEFELAKPNSNTIVFNSMDDIIMLFDKDNENLYRFSSAHSAYPEWSPNKEWLCYWDHDDNLCLTKYDGTNTRWIQIGTNGIHFPRFSPDGNLIVFYAARDASEEFSPYDIYMVHKNGSDLRKITGPELTIDDTCTYGYIAPDWVDNGSKLIFSMAKINKSANKPDTRLVIYDLTNKSLSYITKLDNLSPVHARQSSTRDEIVFMGAPVGSIHPNIYRAGLDGTNVLQLTFDGASGHPDWHADGEQIIVNTLIDMVYKAKIISRNGDLIQILDIDNAFSPNW